MSVSNEINRKAINLLNLTGFEAWRNNNNRAVPGRTFTGKYGVPDVCGYQRFTGLAMYCEGKSYKDVWSQEQFDFMERLTNNGGIGYVAYEDKDGELFMTTWQEYKEKFPNKLAKFLK